MSTSLAAERVEPAPAAGVERKLELKLPGVGGVSDETLLMFTRQLSALLAAGIPLTRAIPLLGEGAENRGFSRALDDVYRRVCGGAPLSHALSEHRTYFSPLYTGMVRMGEVHGDITRVMSSLAEYMQREVALRRELKAAMVYPSFILGFTGLFVLFVFNFILPYFVNIFDSMNIPLPLISRVLVGVVRLLNDPVGALSVVAALVFAAYVVKCWIMSAPGSMQWDSLKIKLPVVGRLLRKVAVARVSRSLALLLSGGINLLVALDLAGLTSGNKAYHKACNGAQDHLRKGQTLYDYFRREPFLFPVHFSQMVQAGEESGRLEDLLSKLAELYEMDVEYALRSFASAIEPLMVLVTGTVIGFIILAVFLPLYGFMNNL